MTLCRLLLLASVALAAGCATPRPDPIPQDGALSRQITWVITDDPQKDCQQLGGSRRTMIPIKTLGCANWKDPRNCVIYLRAPRDEYDRRAIETLGHEVLHCFAGHFHRPVN